MSFASPKNPPPLSRGEIKLFNEDFAVAATSLRYTYVKCLERVLIRHLTPSEYVVLSAICGRTLGWKKLIEVISLAPLSDGMRIADGKPVMANGKPVFLGTPLSKKTVITAIQGLERKGMIARFAVDSYGRTTHAIMPLSVAALSYIVEHRQQYGAVPDFILRGRKAGPLESDHHEWLQLVLAHYLVEGDFDGIIKDWFGPIDGFPE